MKIKLSHIQIIGIALCCLAIAVGVTLGVFTRGSFLKLTQDKDSVSNAVIFIDEELADASDYQYAEMDFDSAKYELDRYSYAFRVKCIDAQPCYHCMKFTVNVIDTVKGDIDEKGNSIVLYQWLGFDKYTETELAFNSPDFSMPLKIGKEYLIFAEKRDYYKDYQRTLQSNEYSLGLMGICPTAFVINDTQENYADISTDKVYSDIEDLYYLCFSQEALDNINKTSKQIISYYCE
ncbi:MAG: hypothetical protein ACI4XC_08870 [Eubacterium sp.]